MKAGPRATAWHFKFGRTRIPAPVLACAAAVAILVLNASSSLHAQTVRGDTALGARPGAFKEFSKNSDAPIDINSEKLVVYDAKKIAVFTGNVRAVQGDSVMTTTELHVFYKGSANPIAGNRAGDRVASVDGRTAAISDAARAGQPEEDSPGSQLSRIEAKGNVLIRSAEDQSARGDHLLYDVEGQTVTLTGNVLIKSGKDQTTRSESAVYDMTKETVTVRDKVVLSGGKEQTANSDWAIYDVSGELVTVGGNVVLTQDKNVLKGNKLVINLATGESRFENTGDAASGNRIRALFMPNEGGKRKSPEGESGAESERGGPTSLIPRSN